MTLDASFTAANHWVSEGGREGVGVYGNKSEKYLVVWNDLVDMRGNRM